MRVNEIIPGPDGQPNYDGPTYPLADGEAISDFEINRFSSFNTLEWAWLKVALREYVASYCNIAAPVGMLELLKELSEA